jgi:hypothetical protein
MPENNLDHLFLDGRFYNAKNYTSPNQGGPKVVARSDINREEQGNFVKVRFEEAIEDFYRGRQEQDFVFVVFKSALGFELDIDKFDDKSSFRIAFTRVIEEQGENGTLSFHQEAGIYLNKKSIKAFLKKIEEFISKNTWQSERAGDPKPRNNALIANIDDVRAATLQSFWQEPELPFPGEDEIVWWEVWLDYNGNNTALEQCKNELALHDIQIGQQWVNFPEHAVGLIKASARTLSYSLLYTDCLSELRKPRDLADFFTYADRIDQNNWIDNLLERVTDSSSDHKVSVCLLDTGVTHGNPLLTPFIIERNLTTIFPDGRVSDKTDIIGGHGTPMAGLILFGDLADVFGYNNPIDLKHHLESVRFIDKESQHDPQNYGFVTSEAISKVTVLNPRNKRIVCLAVSTNVHQNLGIPSAWSAMIDMLSYGETYWPNDSTLFIVSAGNLSDEERVKYPLSNDDNCINDPGQAFNALTVGAYTLRDSIDADTYPDSEILAKRGALSPCSTTSMTWNNEWPRKPDIVMEGGNQALQYGGVLRPDSLQLLSTSKGATLNWLTAFGDTSAATALASRFAAQLYVAYPQLRPETIRALIVHSADWTPAMLQDRKIQALNPEEKSKLIRTVGYGVPHFNRAVKNASNALTLVAEAELKPYKWGDSRVKTDQFHLYELPWPVEVLSDLLNTPVKLSITLSYFVEPNPGNKRYAKANNYMSHALRFKMRGRDESVERFAARISAEMRDDEYLAEGNEKGWTLGESLRNKGSIHKDIWEGPAADLATRNMVAIFPTSGWWKTRKKLERYNNTVHYSLIVSIEAPDVDVDIYNPVKQQIDAKVDIPIEIER